MISLLTLRKIKGKSVMNTTMVDKSIMLHLTLESHQYTFLVDTGTRDSIIYSSSLQNKPLVSAQAFYKSATVYMANGESVKCPLININVVLKDEGYDKYIYTTFLVMKNEQPNKYYDGLLGMSFLEAIKGVIDLEHKKVLYSINDENDD